MKIDGGRHGGIRYRRKDSYELAAIVPGEHANQKHCARNILRFQRPAQCLGGFNIVRAVHDDLNSVNAKLLVSSWQTSFRYARGQGRMILHCASRRTSRHCERQILRLIATNHSGLEPRCS